jgi:hypothetical protein
MSEHCEDEVLSSNSVVAMVSHITFGSMFDFCARNASHSMSDVRLESAWVCLVDDVHLIFQRRQSFITSFVENVKNLQVQAMLRSLLKSSFLRAA